MKSLRDLQRAADVRSDSWDAHYSAIERLSRDLRLARGSARIRIHFQLVRLVAGGLLRRGHPHYRTNYTSKVRVIE